VRRLNNRVAMSLPVEMIAGGKKLRAVTQDLSPYGMFVRMAPPLPVGTTVQLAISPDGERHVTIGQVTHSMCEVEGRTLGRFPGVGIAFRDPVSAAGGKFADAVGRMLLHHTANLDSSEIRIVVADPQHRLLERLSTSLDIAGFAVATATNGMEAISACLTRTPDVVLVERDMPVLDGLHVLQEMGRHPALAGVPVMMMSAAATDLIRLQALQHGAVDFIPKPFTVLEIILRARRWARASQRDGDRVFLRGTLAELGLPSLLTMFEHERRSGQLSVTREHLVAFIDVVDGKIARARSNNESITDSRQLLMSVLDWKDGYFELSSGQPAPIAPELETSITHLLIEHAQRRDEATR